MNAWVKGIITACISGAAGGVINAFAAVGIAPEIFNMKSGIGLLHLVSMAGVGAITSAILGVALYLKQSPLPNGSSQTNQKGT